MTTLTAAPKESVDPNPIGDSHVKTSPLDATSATKLTEVAKKRTNAMTNHQQAAQVMLQDHHLP